MTRTIPRKLVVTSIELAPDDNDLSTRRWWRDPKWPGGTGQRAPLVPVDMIRVPSCPEWVAAGGARCERLYWCDECDSYQHPECHPCTERPGDDSGWLYL